MKAILASIILGMLVLTACSPALPAAYTNSTGSAQSSEGLPGPQTPAPPIVDSLPANVRAIVEKAPGALTGGFSYVYSHVAHGRAVNETVNFAKVAAKGTKRKMTLVSGPQLNQQFALNAVITDSADKSATGVCTLSVVCPSPVTRAMNYSDFQFVGPEEWGPALQDARDAGSEQISDRTTEKLIGTIQGVPTTIWVDTYSGLTLQANQGNDTWMYSGLQLGVDDSALTP